MSSASGSPNPSGPSSLPLPSPDSREGIVLAIAAGFALLYVLVLALDYHAMTNFAFEVTTVSLIVSLIGAFALSGMLGADIATYQRFELELARTVLAYVSSGTPPAPDAPLAGVWKAHVAGAEEYRRMARAHAYELGLFTWAALLSLGATLIAGLGAIVGNRDVLGLGMLVEWPAFGFLVAAAGAAVAAVGYSAASPVYELIAPWRWRRNGGRQSAFEGAVSEVGWLSEFANRLRDARIGPAGPGPGPDAKS